MQTACAFEAMKCPQNQSKIEFLKLQTQLTKCAQKPWEDAAKDLHIAMTHPGPVSPSISITGCHVAVEQSFGFVCGFRHTLTTVLSLHQCGLLASSVASKFAVELCTPSLHVISLAWRFALDVIRSTATPQATKKGRSLNSSCARCTTVLYAVTGDPHVQQG